MARTRNPKGSKKARKPRRSPRVIAAANALKIKKRKERELKTATNKLAKEVKKKRSGS
jgi:hypothetical protein